MTQPDTRCGVLRPHPGHPTAFFDDDGVKHPIDCAGVDTPSADTVRRVNAAIASTTASMLGDKYVPLAYPIPGEPDTRRPHIVTLCGSTRFKDEINAANARLTMEGKLVISLGVFGHTDLPDHDWTTGGTDTKVMLDRLHRHKIDLADSVFVVTDDSGYFGESTRAEIAYALSTGKPVDFTNTAARERWVDGED